MRDEEVRALILAGRYDVEGASIGMGGIVRVQVVVHADGGAKTVNLAFALKDAVIVPAQEKSK